MDFDGLTYKAAALLEAARDAGLKLATAESCTGGLVSALLTDIPGSSHVFDRGFVTYSNEAKHEILSVPMELIQTHGAVSEEVARAMAEGALGLSRADIAVAITGIAGPGGGTEEKPVGTVCFAVARRGGETRSETRYYGDMGRSRVRMKSVEKALKLMELFL